jgi:hypothetical protein
VNVTVRTKVDQKGLSVLMERIYWYLNEDGCSPGFESDTATNANCKCTMDKVIIMSTSTENIYSAKNLIPAFVWAILNKVAGLIAWQPKLPKVPPLFLR